MKSAIRKLTGASIVDKKILSEVVKDIQRALLYADVNWKIVANLTKNVEKRAIEEKPIPGITLKEHIIKIIYDELVAILGKTKEIDFHDQRILMLGLYGQGKTTSCGKLAKFIQKRGQKVVLIAADTHRPAAYDQLKQISEQVGCAFFGIPGETRAAKIVRDALTELKGKYDVMIVDSAGRHGLEEELIEEIKRIATIFKPTETILVIDATIGQQAGVHAKAFHDAVGVSSVLLTKLDGSAKGGGALSAVAETGASIIFIGTGEHLDDLEKFEPTRFISRLLGMGDIQTLLDKFQEHASQEKLEKLGKKFISGKFTLEDLYEQMEILSSAGPLKKLISMLPWVPQKIDDDQIAVTQEKLKLYRYIMDSMTDEELREPEIIKGSRISRIAIGAGVDPKHVRDLLKQYQMIKKSIKGITSNRKLRRILEKQLGENRENMGL